ncbi:MAG: hypothetical protein U9Q82_01265 [Chloroflexota bacterium]|nr:hypothetical protein [Chloroflexota bacterium]
MNKKSFLLAFFVLLLASLACGTTTPIALTPTIHQGQLETIVAATVQALDTSPEAQPEATDAGISSSPTAQPPSSTPTSTATQEQPPCQPEHPGAQVLPLPAGFASSVDVQPIELYDTQGNLLGSKQAPGLTWLEPGQIHIAGGQSQGIPNIPLVYHSLENGGVLKSNTNGEVVQINQSPGLVTLTGGEGNSIIAYSTNDSDQAAGGWISRLYAGELAAINAAQPLMTRSEGEMASSSTRWQYTSRMARGKESGTRSRCGASATSISRPTTVYTTSTFPVHR